MNRSVNNTKIRVRSITDVQDAIEFYEQHGLHKSSCFDNDLNRLKKQYDENEMGHCKVFVSSGSSVFFCNFSTEINTDITDEFQRWQMNRQDFGLEFKQLRHTKIRVHNDAQFQEAVDFYSSKGFTPSMSMPRNKKHEFVYALLSNCFHDNDKNMEAECQEIITMHVQGTWMWSTGETKTKKVESHTETKGSQDDYFKYGHGLGEGHVIKVNFGNQARNLSMRGKLLSKLEVMGFRTPTGGSLRKLSRSNVLFFFNCTTKTVSTTSVEEMFYSNEANELTVSDLTVGQACTLISTHIDVATLENDVVSEGKKRVWLLEYPNTCKQPRRIGLSNLFLHPKR